MNRSQRAVGFAAFLVGYLSPMTQSQAAEPIPVMLLDGEASGPYHDWPRTTAAMQRILAEPDRFKVTVVTATPATDFSTFNPEFQRYRTIVLNYDPPDERWPEALKRSFEKYVEAGGGVVVVHAADNAFPNWRAYNEMIGIGGWRGRTDRAGPYWYFRDDALISDASPGPAGSHGPRVPYTVIVRDAEHPIMQGLPQRWLHGDDELYAHLRGPGGMTVLASAYSPPDRNGSGRDEPQVMVLVRGKGRIFHTTFGHDVRALSSVDFITLLQRAVEWTATGKVTQKLPADFPNDAAPRYRDAIAGSAP